MSSSTIDTEYTTPMVLLLTAIGTVFFRESLGRYEVLGLAMAICSLILLVRFA